MQSTAGPEIVAGRYRLERLLARGGMGEVFAAVDLSTARAIAFKRMLPDVRQQRSLVVHFMREYHALSELQHPRIIEVYDYGVDNSVPYFTMELLDGHDLGELSPLPYREACRYLRDVASSLSLLHARRVLHRDLSPRNVRRTSDGRCKLLDFGAMVPFGIPPNLTGTPPCIAPEALQGAPLDQRSDLYSLGALAYIVLTGRHAYAVTQLGALPSAWKHPPARPKRVVPDIPEPLDALVTALMSLDPAKRPQSAAEVIDSLAAIGQLEPDDSPAVARSFLVSSQLVGRERECAVLQAQLNKALTGEGSAIAISGEAGSGRTRMLAEAALIAQTCGLTVVRLVARAGHGAASTLVDDLLAGIQRALPREAASLRKNHPLVEALSTTPSRTTVQSVERRAQLVAQVVGYVKDIARERPLLITVDDVDRADDLSSALVAELAHIAVGSAFALIASHDSRADASILTQVAGLVLPLSLPLLDRDQTMRLVASLFGEVANLERVSDWLLRTARGNPKLTLELAEHLLARGIVRYSAGAWVLPAEVAEPVPPSAAETLLLRLRDLSAVATRLAELLSVRRGGADAACFLDLAGEPGPVTFRALDELVRAGVFESAGDEYVFVHKDLRDALASSLAPERSRELHERWADWLLSRGPLDEDGQLEAGWHLVHTERALLGADLLAKVGPALVERRVAMAAAVPAMERALELYERHDRPLRDRLYLRALLVLSSYLFDHRLAKRYAAATLDALYPFTGLAAAERLSRYFGRKLGFWLGLGWAALRWCFRFGPHRGPHVIEALVNYGRAGMGVLGLHALALDVASTREVLARMRGFQDAPLPILSLIYNVAEAITLNGQGCWADAKRAIERAHQRLRGAKSLFMSDEEHSDLLTGLLLLKGINTSYRVHADALECAQELEGLGTHLAAVAAMRVRMTYHLWRGDRELTQQYRRQLDLHAIQHGTNWQVDWIAIPIEGLAAMLSRDLPTLRGALGHIEQLVRQEPAFVDIRDTILLDYHFVRGDYAETIALGEKFIARHPPRTYISWMSVNASTALAYLELGQPERAKVICEQALQHTSEEDREFMMMIAALDAAYATTLAVLGERERAEAIFTKYLERLRGSDEHQRLFQVLAYRVEMLRLIGDHAALRVAADELRVAAVASGNPDLIAQAERTAELRLRQLTPLPAANEGGAPARPEVSTADTTITDVTVAVRRPARHG